MKTETFTQYIADDGKVFWNESSCKEYETKQEELKKRLGDLITRPKAELEILIEKLKWAEDSAYDPDIIDTMGTPQARALYYMKNVCQKFVDKYKDLKMI